MTLQNGYKVIYEKAADGKRSFYASTTGVFAEAELIAEVELGKYKLIYEKAGNIYGSETGVPAESDDCFTAFDKIFKAASEEPKDEVTETPEESIELPKDEPTIEDPIEEEGEF